MSAVEARVTLLQFGTTDPGPVSLRGEALDAVLRRLRE